MNYLEPPQTISRTGEHVDAMLGVKQYAERNGHGERTVRTWLADGRLHGARKLHGVWMIPADEQPAEPMVESVAAAIDRRLSVEHVQHVPQAGGIVHELANVTAFLPLEYAAGLLGISEYAVRHNREYFELMPFGPNGSLVMPAAVVRRVAGLA